MFLGYNFPIVKRLLSHWRWIVGAAIIFGAITFVAYEQHYAAEKYKRHRQEYCSALAASTEQKKACIEEGTSVRDYLPWGYILVSWPEGITTWAIIFTVFVIAWQSYETRKAADAAAKSADAADKSIALQFRKERGFLEITGNGIEIEDGPDRAWNLVGDIQLTNSGNIPLRILSGDGECLVLNIGDCVPSIHSQKLQQIGLPNTWIRPRDNGSREEFWSDDIQESKTQFARMLANTEVKIILRGRIEYESHRLAWRRFYGFTWISDGTKSADGITKGQWAEDPDIENEEYEIPAPPQCPF